MSATTAERRPRALEPAELRPMAPQWFVEGLSVAGIIALALGVRLLETTSIGGALAPAVSGALSQLPATGVALVLVFLATAANVWLGAIAARVVLGRPFDGLTSMLLAGLSSAIVIDCLLLMILGGLGLFIWPVILAIHAAGLAGGILRGSPMLDRREPTEAEWRTPSLALLLPVVVWGAPILLQLASPVVPFMDVLFNHVAPVEHAREFGSFAELTTSPAANLGPSRTLFGYVALQSVIATLVDLPAHLSVAAFALPLTIFIALGSWRAASALFGTNAGYWSLITVPLTFVFLRVPDARATVLVFACVTWSVAVLVDPPTTTRLRQQLLLGLALGAGLYVHPFIGGLALITVAVLCVVWPARFAELGVPAAVAAGLLALPQAAATLGIAIPSWAGIVAVPLALGGLWVADRIRGAVVMAGRVLLAASALGALLVAADLARYIWDSVRDVALPFPLVTAGALAGAVVVRDRRVGWQVIVVGIVVALLTVAGTRLLPGDSPLVASLQVESTPKALWYWSPFLLALAAGGTLSRLAAFSNGPALGLLSRALVAASVVVAVMPIRIGPSTADINNYTEHRMAESASIVLHHAQNGYWVGYPDSRNLVDGSQVEILSRLQAERDQGLLTADSRLLHIAPSFQPWIATPVAIFTGIHETIAALETDPSVHGEGGREYLVGELPRLLQDRYDYVLIEGGDLLAQWRDDVEGLGYRLLMTNERGELFGLAGAAARP